MPLVGRTPLIRIRYKYKGQERTIYSKYESMNMTGSIKDRMAYWILNRGYESGQLREDSIISCVSSGNTGVSFSAIGAALGHQVRVYMPSWMSNERREIIKSFGSEIVNVTKEEGGFVGAMRMQTNALKQSQSSHSEHLFTAQQFDNKNNAESHFLFTGQEISTQLCNLGLSADVFIAGVGTGGTVMGVGQHLKQYHNRNIIVHALEPQNSPILSLKIHLKENSHRIQGISDEFVPSIIDYDALDSKIHGVWDGDAILMAQKLARFGLGVGISSGANFIGAVESAEDMKNSYGMDPTVVTVFPDSSKKYISTDLFKTEPE
eukprot:254144_1